jgi:hypothetical protein
MQQRLRARPAGRVQQHESLALKQSLINQQLQSRDTIVRRLTGEGRSLESRPCCCGRPSLPFIRLQSVWRASNRARPYRRLNSWPTFQGVRCSDVTAARSLRAPPPPPLPPCDGRVARSCSHVEVAAVRLLARSVGWWVSLAADRFGPRPENALAVANLHEPSVFGICS